MREQRLGGRLEPLALLLRGLRADPIAAEPLGVGLLSEQQLDGVMRCWQPLPRR